MAIHGKQVSSITKPRFGGIFYDWVLARVDLFGPVIHAVIHAIIHAIMHAFNFGKTGADAHHAKNKGGTMTTKLTVPQAKIELLLLQAGVSTIDEIDIVTRLTNAGLPQEVVTRVSELWKVTQEIGGQTVELGKVLLTEILKFVDENQHLAIGVAMGAAVGSLINLVPFFGSMLAPLFIAIGAFIGGVAGARIDRGGEPGDSLLGIAQEVIIVANKFFQFLVSIFKALKADLVAE